MRFLLLTRDVVSSAILSFMNVSLTLKSFKSHRRVILLHLQVHYFTTHFTENAFEYSLSSLQCGSLLQALTSSKCFRKGMQLHAYAISSGILVNNTYLNTKLAAFYAICGSMSEARVIFDGTTLKNSFLWNSIIRGYACNGFSMDSLVLYREMLGFGQKADNFTYPFVLKACGDLLYVGIGKKIHCEVIVMGLEFDIYVANSLLAMYSRFGDMETAWRLFDRMPVRDITSWNTIISGYAKNDEPGEALMVFGLMGKVGMRADCASLLAVLPACANLEALKQGKGIHGFAVRNNVGLLATVLVNSLIDVYCNCNFMVGARLLFGNVIEKDTVTWNSLISGYAHNGQLLESLQVFQLMVSDGAKSDAVTFITVLGACNEITALQFGKSIHSIIERKGFTMHTVVGTALVDMYAKCGSLGCSCKVFNELPEKNLVCWSAMIGGLGLHGMGREAIAVFDEMKENGIEPDEVSFTSILSACSHAGLVDEGLQIFDEMLSAYGLNPGINQYSCMVDLLGRAGRLDEAYQLINTMKIKPSFDIWASLLSACRTHRNVKLAEVAATNAFHLNPQGFGPYVMLSSIYAAEKKWENVERVRRMARQRGVRKPPGCSFIELDKVIYRFLVGDKSHLQSKAIYNKLEELSWQLKETGYVPDTSSVFYNVEEDVKEKMLWDHSERLAVAFALINTAPRMCIRITKNLRVCGDCHTVIKIISKLMGREIIMRDAHRFHHFSNGLCSCGDYCFFKVNNSPSHVTTTRGQRIDVLRDQLQVTLGIQLVESYRRKHLNPPVWLLAGTIVGVLLLFTDYGGP